MSKKTFSQIFSETPFHRDIHNLLFHYLTHLDSILISFVLLTKSELQWKKGKKKITPMKNANEIYKFLHLLNWLASWFLHIDYRAPHHQNYYRMCNAQCALHLQTITLPAVEKISQRTFATKNRATDLVSTPDEKVPCYHLLVKPEYKPSIIYNSIPVLGF